MNNPDVTEKLKTPAASTPASGSPAWMKPGAKVWTESTSGSPTRCTVIEPDRIIDGEWLLNSPEHGYAIQRHWRECEPPVRLQRVVSLRLTRNDILQVWRDAIVGHQTTLSTRRKRQYERITIACDKVLYPERYKRKQANEKGQR